MNATARMVEDYVQTLDAALAGAEPAIRSDTLAGVREHIANAQAAFGHPATPEEARAILDDLGAPARIAADAVGGDAEGGHLTSRWVPVVYAALMSVGVAGTWLGFPWFAVIAAVVVIASSPLWSVGERAWGIAGPIVAGIVVYFAVWISRNGIGQRVEGHAGPHANGPVEAAYKTFDGPRPLAIGIALAVLCLIPAAIGVVRAERRATALSESRRTHR